MSTETKKTFKISTRIYLILFSIMGLTAVAIAFLLYSLDHLHERHHELLVGDVAEAELALQMEVELKKEIEDWKDLLLRGDDMQERKRLHDSMNARHEKIDEMARKLRAMLEHANDTDDLTLLEDFEKSHGHMLIEFNKAEADYSRMLAEDATAGAGTAIQAADKITHGIDERPSHDLEEIVHNLVEHTDKVEEELGQEVRSEITMMVVGMVALFAGATFVAFNFGRRIKGNLDGFVDRFHDVSSGEGDLTARIRQESNDELGQLAEYFNKLMGNLQDLMKQVQLCGITVNSSSTEIAAGSREQEAAVAELAATAKEIAATTTEISATANELMQTMHDVSNVTSSTAQQAAQSKLGLETMERTMGQMVDSAGNITNRLSVLSEKASNISSVVTTIMKVADQTNLLSLNAAIEAEKAGEFGLGFAVVANEVRRLADQTAMASTDIEQMVKEMQSAVSAAVMGMDGFAGDIRHGADDVRQVAGQIGQIIIAVQELVPRFENIKEGMAAQTNGAAQISEGVNMVVESSEQSAEALRQNNIAVMQLNEAAEELQAAVNQFKISEGDENRRMLDEARKKANQIAANVGSGNGAGGARQAALEKIAHAQRQAQQAQAQAANRPQPAAALPQPLNAQQQAAMRQAQQQAQAQARAQQAAQQQARAQQQPVTPSGRQPQQPQQPPQQPGQPGQG